MWYHKPTKTLIEADVLFNLPCPDQAGGSMFPKSLLSYMSPSAGFHRLAVSAFSKGNPKAFTAAAREIASLDMKRIIPCHGAVIEGTGGEANKAWAQAYSKFLDTKTK